MTSIDHARSARRWAHGRARQRRRLCALEFERPRTAASARSAAARAGFRRTTIVDGDTPIIDRTRDWLARYFDGVSAGHRELPLGCTARHSSSSVWHALLRDPPWHTCSYGSIAKALGSDGASRAVGMANGANPIAIIVPCHRVIGANGSLTGYGGGLDRKTWLLNHEARWRADRLF